MKQAKEPQKGAKVNRIVVVLKEAIRESSFGLLYRFGCLGAFTATLATLTAPPDLERQDSKCASQNVEGAKQFLEEHYIAEFNRLFPVPAAQSGTTIVARAGRDIEGIFSLARTAG